MSARENNECEVRVSLQDRPDTTGCLYLVPTPIGNLGDITRRAVEVLGEVDLIAAEDTRHSRHLLNHLGINAELTAYHEHNENQVADRLLDRVAAGERIALISDAGTPLISDPGYVLVHRARERGLSVVPLPGPSAALCALSGSGLASDRFLFLGFPPRSSSKRRALFETLARESATLIFYESGKRTPATLDDLAVVFGAERQAVLARELTKRFETFLAGSLSELAEAVASDPDQQLGEQVLIVDGHRSDADEDLSEGLRVCAILADELPHKQAVALAARITGVKKNRLYAAALKPEPSA